MDPQQPEPEISAEKAARSSQSLPAGVQSILGLVLLVFGYFFVFPPVLLGFIRIGVIDESAPSYWLEQIVVPIQHAHDHFSLYSDYLDFLDELILI